MGGKDHRVLLRLNTIFIYLFILFTTLTFFKIFIYLFGCIRSQLQHTGSSSRHAGSFVVVLGLLSSCNYGLHSCSTWALQLWRGCSIWDLSSPTRDQTHVPCTGRQILNHWTTREVPLILLLNVYINLNLHHHHAFEIHINKFFFNSLKFFFISFSLICSSIPFNLS